MESRSKKLRTGYTTGACAAAAAKAAMVLLVRSSECGVRSEERLKDVEIPFPDGSRVKFRVHSSEFGAKDSKLTATASVIKDAGDDPDVTHGAEIVAEVRYSAECGMRNAEYPKIIIKGGNGVGTVTKPGLAIPVGEAAINPVPRKMIHEAVMEAIRDSGIQPIPLPTSPLKGEEFGGFPPLQGEGKGGDGSPYTFLVTISVPRGEELAKKTLNHRLGIVGGISILGTTGIVRPISTEAYTASITAAMDVAKATGNETVVLSSGRTSEKAHMKKFHFPEESYVMMGDYLEFSLLEAKRHGFSTIHLCAQWAKMIKTAMSIPQTHVRHGALEARKARNFLQSMGHGAWSEGQEFNTARDLFDCISSASPDSHSVFSSVCSAAKQYAERIASGIPVIVHLVSYEGEILAESE